jgi:hypothetical protein
MGIERSIEGTWSGRLVDVQGFEGQIKLRLASHDQKRGRVRGDVEVTIGEVDEGITADGDVSGELDGESLTLVFSLPKTAVMIRAAGRVFPLRAGGLGLRAIYQVSAEAFSPLQAGIVTAATGMVQDELTAVPREHPTPQEVQQRPTRRKKAS